MIKLLVCALLSIPSAASAAEAPLDIHGLVDRANKAMRGDASRGVTQMTITTPKWTRTVEIEGWNRDRTMAFITIRAPAKDRGTITLRRKNEMWLWLPKVERVIKIPPTMMHTSWQGSDFTYEDIVKADSIVKDYTHKLLETKTAGDLTTYKIEALPKADAPVVWGRVLFWVGQRGEDVFPMKEEDYSERGDLIRTITLSDLKVLGGRLLPSKLECLPARKAGQKTTLLYKEIDFNVSLPDDFFSLSRLQSKSR